MARSPLAQQLWRKASTVDRLVWSISPRRGMARAHRRLMDADPDYADAVHFCMTARGYKAAAPGKNKTPWIHASDRDADAEIVPDLRTLRNRSRATTRDDPIGAGIVATLVRKVVGTGIRSQVRTGDPQKDQAIELVEWELLQKIDQANDLDYAAHQRLLYQRTLEDGDVLLRAVVSQAGDPVWIEVVEADRLATPLDASPVDPEGRIVAGVEKDRHGRPVAYWVCRKHPGEADTSQTKRGTKDRLGRSTLSRRDFDRVPVGQAKLIRSRVTRPGQTRGVVLFHACVQDLHDLDLLILAALKRTQVAACIAMFITSEGDSETILELTAEDYGYQLDQTIEPAMMFRLFPGEKAEFLNPQAGVPDLDRFVMLLARRIGASVGLSPETVLQAWTGLSYSTARTIKTGEQQTIRLERSALVGQALLWERRVVLEDALLRGDQRLLSVGVTAQDLADLFVEHLGDEEQWVDPQAEASATREMLDMGLTSPQIECARLGRDYRDVLRQRLEAEKLEAEMREEMGLPNAAPKGEKPPLKMPAQDEDEDEQVDEDEGEQPAKEAA